MCGIAGFVDYSKSLIDGDVELKLMGKALEKRGTDDSGIMLHSEKNYLLGFAHQRLSILDLSPMGKQPMTFEHLTIVYNGEIYNYKEIRKRLISKGYTFKSDTDTEVILIAYNEWGEACLKEFNGMFAFAIFNKRDEQVFIVRDRIGIKPLFYGNFGDVFIFASELKAFHQLKFFRNNKKVSIQGASHYFKFGFIPAPYSIFENVSKIEPGQSMMIDLKNKSLKKKKYWNNLNLFQNEKHNKNISLKESINELDKLLVDSVQKRFIADVKVGTFLSGGIDSSLVSAIAVQKIGKISTFSIGFENEKYNEANHAKKIAKFLGTEHHENYLRKNDIIDLMTSIPIIYDEPLADNSVFPTTFLCRFAKQHVTVALSGDGGDELFSGYEGYLSFNKRYKAFGKIPSFIKDITALPLDFYLNFINKSSGSQYKLNKLIELLKSRNISEFQNAYIYGTPEKIKNKILPKALLYNSAENLLEEDSISNVYLRNLNETLPEQLLSKVDRASMATSLEVRVPILDHRIVEFAYKTLPDRFKVKGNISKFVLREVMYKYIPKEVIDKKKKGFTFPYWTFLEKDGKHIVYEYLNKEALRNSLLNTEYVLKARDDFYNNQFPHHLIWKILVFAMWEKEWMNS